MPPQSLAPIQKGSAILIAFSGGADSRALLHRLALFCKNTRAPLFAAHVNHGIRGDEAISDRDFCVRTAAEYGVECFVLDADVPAIARGSGESIETAARRVRYEFFERLMREHDIPLLATAHNADDCLETLIFNIARGTGLRGIASIPPCRRLGDGYVIRPLLGAAKSDILAYCEFNRLEYVIDSTNTDTAYSRNLIRHKIIPLLEELNPGLRANAARLAATARESCDFIDGIAAEAITEVAGENRVAGDSLAGSVGFDDGVPLERIAALHPAVRSRAVSLLCERERGITLEQKHINDITWLILRGVNGSSVSLPGRTRAKIADCRLKFCDDPRKKRDVKSEKFSTPLSVGENELPRGRIVLTPVAPPPKQNRTTCAADTLIIPCALLPLTARSIAEGDTIRQGGMTKKVRRLLAAAGIPAEARHLHPIVWGADGSIVWIPGVAVRDGINNETDSGCEDLSGIGGSGGGPVSGCRAVYYIK